MFKAICSRLSFSSVQRTKPPKPNLSKAEKRAMKELKQYDDIVILNADKGNSTVVTDKLKYDQKLLELLSDSATYQVILKNSPSLWLRYVDDVYAIMEKTEVEPFHDYLNTICMLHY